MEDFQKKFILALLAYAVKRDLSPKELCKLSAIEYKSLHSTGDANINPGSTNELWKQAAHLSKDPLFGLHFGESMQLAALGVIGQIIQTSATVGEALTNAGALTKFLTDMFQVQVSHDKKSFTIHLLADKHNAEKYPFTYRHMADYLMVFMNHEMDGLLLEKIVPLSVTVPYYLSDQYEYTRVFRSTTIRKADVLSMEFSNSFLGLPVLSANYALQELLLRKINDLSAEKSNANSLQARIYDYLLTNSYLNNFSQENVAANFNMSSRNMQRKLKEEETSFQEIVEEVRKKLAMNYLSSGNYQLKDIANMLGYNEVSAFARAFKRWTGQTPAEFQRSAL